MNLTPTAAHCTHNRDILAFLSEYLPDDMKTYWFKPEDMFVLVGGHKLPYNDQVPSFQHIENNNNFRRVSEIIIHEKYVPEVAVAPNYDFAIFKLKVSLVFSAKIGPVCLSEFPSSKHAGRVGMVSGWGAKDYNGTEVSLVVLEKVPSEGS